MFLSTIVFNTFGNVLLVVVGWVDWLVGCWGGWLGVGLRLNVSIHPIRLQYDLITHSVHYECPELRRNYPLNLSISVSGGKETNKDSRSNGE